MIATASAWFAQIHPPEPIVLRTDWANVSLLLCAFVALAIFVALVGVVVWLVRRSSR